MQLSRFYFKIFNVFIVLGDISEFECRGIMMSLSANIQHLPGSGESFF